jgi:hypothetical protein
MIYKVRLTHSVDVFIEAATEDEIEDWMMQTIPAKALEQSNYEATSDYSEEILCEVNGTPDIVLESAFEKALQENIQYLSKWIPVTQAIKDRVMKHMKDYKKNKIIIEFYHDKDDFYEDWKGIGYTEKEADILLKNEVEFMFLPEDAGIARFNI